MKNENNIFFFYLFYCNLSVLSIVVDVLLYLLNFKELEKNKKIIKNRDPKPTISVLHTIIIIPIHFR